MIKWPWKISESQPEFELPWQEALNVPILASLSQEEQRRLVEIASTFLTTHNLILLQSLTLQPVDRARIALLFSLPVLNLGPEWLDSFSEVLIYPDPFMVDDEWEDEMGLVHRQQVVQSGQSWQQGPVVLNWLDIQDSFDTSGFNLIVHEVAHKLDMRGGDRASGIPAMSLREVAGWQHALNAAMEEIQEEIDTVGENAATIDAYAATDPAECFAVLSEYFFSAPMLFAPRFPELWQLFCRFYRQDPILRLEDNSDAVH
ncbi:protein MtfA [Salmonella enterica subsp. enterica serovar Choleraesuis]|nr:protein MtfA [Salmonella enterica subsp. enterica serovar Choleraesuis]